MRLSLSSMAQVYPPQAVHRLFIAGRITMSFGGHFSPEWLKQAARQGLSATAANCTACEVPRNTRRRTDGKKSGIASEKAATPFITQKSRDAWPQVSVSWGLYDCKDEDTDREMSPSVFTSSVAESFSRCDHFIWLYFEEQNLLSGDAPQWIKAIDEGRKQGFANRKSARAALMAR
jgi:hypothetical protein